MEWMTWVEGTWNGLDEDDRNTRTSLYHTTPLGWRYSLHKDLESYIVEQRIGRHWRRELSWGYCGFTSS
jgi:hypothetical protein